MMTGAANYFVIVDRRDRFPVAYWLPAALREEAPRVVFTSSGSKRAQTEAESAALHSFLQESIEP
jgi:hypothetical protein